MRNILYLFNAHLIFLKSILTFFGLWRLELNIRYGNIRARGGRGRKRAKVKEEDEATDIERERVRGREGES